MEDIINIDHLLHKYWSGEGRNIRILHFCKIKSPVTNVWLDGVAYKELALDYSEIFVRPLVDFKQKFKPNPALSDIRHDD